MPNVISCQIHMVIIISHLFNFFLEKKVFYDENSFLLEMSEDSLIDIDTLFEYRLAKGLLIKD